MPFDKQKAQKAIEWFPRYLVHVKTEWAGVPFELLPWQKKVIGLLFGTVKENGYRQYNTVYVEIPKKNGKSELAAGIALKLLFADNEPGAEIYSAAVDKLQASIVFDVAAMMVRMNSKLGRRCKILDSTKRIVHNNYSFYRVLSADAPSKHGFNVHGVMFDELHAQPNAALWNVLTKGAGDARRQPVTFAITTAGHDRHSVCWKQHEYALKVRDGIIKDPTFLPVIYGADMEEDWTDEKVWRKCNPSLGLILDVEKLRTACKTAQELPSDENDFRRLRLNQWVKQESRYIPMHKWNACGEPFEPAELKGRVCYAGLDLASSIDIAAFVMAFADEDLIKILCRFWIPDENIEQRARKDNVDYDRWVKEGYIIATPGNVIDYDFIEAEIDKLGSTYHIEEIAFDRWGAIQMSQHLQEKGFTMVDFGQGYRSMSPPTKDLLRLILGQNIRHGGNPVLTWMADNVVVTKDPAENVKPDKSKSTERIDGIVAMIMALDRLQRGSGVEQDMEIFTAS